jgi:trehalose 6-phosphate synthase complex regulatory subunit
MKFRLALPFLDQITNIYRSIQGVRHKLLAFEAFLDKHPEYHQKVVLIQVALQTSEENEAHGGVADVVARINSRFSTLTYQPVVFLHTDDLSFSQYLALLTVADAFLVTSMREGMALRTHEFVVCQEERHRPLILSEVCRLDGFLSELFSICAVHWFVQL